MKLTTGLTAPRRCADRVDGADIRALRCSRSWTLNDLADRLDRSVDVLLQVERGRPELRLRTWPCGGRTLRLPVSFFFSQSPYAGVRGRCGARGQPPQHDRRGAGRREPPSPDLWRWKSQDQSLPPARCPEPFVRPTEEAGYVIEGSLTLIIDGEEIRLE